MTFRIFINFFLYIYIYKIIIIKERKGQSWQRKQRLIKRTRKIRGVGQGRLAKSCGRNQNDWKSDNALQMFMLLVSFMVNTKKTTKIRS